MRMPSTEQPRQTTNSDSGPTITPQEPEKTTGSVMKMAYGGWGTDPDPGNEQYRISRGQPFYRAGRLVFATPQFRAQTVYTPTSTNTQLPSTNQTNVSVAYPTKAK